MKTEKTTRAVAVLAVSCAVLGPGYRPPASAGEGTNRTESATASANVPPPVLTKASSASTAAAEDLGVYFCDGKTNKIARVYSADPLSVFVIFEGGTSGRRIPRQELPPQLAAKYPYNAEKAAAYRQQQADLAAQEAAAAAKRAAAQSAAREKDILTKIDALNKRDVELQKEKNILKKLHAGNGRRVRLGQINDELEANKREVNQLNSQLEKLRAKRAAAPVP